MLFRVFTALLEFSRVRFDIHRTGQALERMCQLLIRLEPVDVGLGNLRVATNSQTYSGRFSYLSDFPGSLARQLVPFASGQSHVAVATMLREPEGSIISFINRSGAAKIRIENSEPHVAAVEFSAPLDALVRAVVDAYDDIDQVQYASWWPNHVFPTEALAELKLSL